MQSQGTTSESPAARRPGAIRGRGAQVEQLAVARERAREQQLARRPTSVMRLRVAAQEREPAQVSVLLACAYTPKPPASATAGICTRPDAANTANSATKPHASNRIAIWKRRWAIVRSVSGLSVGMPTKRSSWCNLAIERGDGCGHRQLPLSAPPGIPFSQLHRENRASDLSANRTYTTSWSRVSSTTPLSFG